MADRYFPNEMPDFVKEGEAVSATGSNLRRLLALPYSKLSEKLLKAGLDLKEKIVEETWIKTGKQVNDYSLYTGALGTAYLLFKSYQATKSESDLTLSAEIIKACLKASKGLSSNQTFICGTAGVYALGVVVFNLLEDHGKASFYIQCFNEISEQITSPNTASNELLYGKAGYLWASSLINNHISKYKNTVPAYRLNPIVKEVITDGRNLSNKLKHKAPLMYQWRGQNYMGAVVGLAGIMQALMDMNLSQDEQEDVKATLDYIIQSRFPGGNYPSIEGSTEDQLVHWCHGACGISLTLAKAYEVFKEERFLRAAADAAEEVWNRGLVKKVGLCHGISGNAYTFLSLYRNTGKLEYLYRAKAFACFLLDKGNQLTGDGIVHSGDHPFSLFEGQAGVACLFLDMVNPSESRFPGYELHDYCENV